MINLHFSHPVGLTGCTWPNSLQAAITSSSSSQSTANCPLMKSAPLLVLPPPATGVDGMVEWLPGGGRGVGLPPTLGGYRSRTHTCWYFALTTGLFKFFPPAFPVQYACPSLWVRLSVRLSIPLSSHPITFAV